jgi:cephalosporin-C deacetylase
MRLIQQQLEELGHLDVPLTREEDFASFWDMAVKKVKKHDVTLSMKLSDYPLKGVKIFDSIFHGLDGTPVRCWIMLPETAKPETCPVMVNFHGGGGHRGYPPWFLHWIMNGYAVISMDFRQQGGLTGSNTPLTRSSANSFSVMNILDYRSYYLYHAWTDALLSVKIAGQLEEIDRSKIVVSGLSQGGGTSLVMAALNPDISVCLAAVPSYCWWERRIFIRSACAADISRFIACNPEYEETVYKTMSYYDVINFADRIKCPVTVSCGLKDELTPPDCVYAAYNKIRSEKYIHNYSAGGHTLEPVELERWLRFLDHKFA